MALQFRHSATRDSARRVASNASTTVLTSAGSRAVTWQRQGRQMNFGLYAPRKASISTGMGDEHAPRRWRRQQPQRRRRTHFHREGWAYEEKLDGWRMFAYKDGRTVHLESRTSVDHSRRFPELVAAVAALPGRTLVLDGEVATMRRTTASPIPKPLRTRSEPGSPCTNNSKIRGSRSGLTPIPVS